MRARPYVFAGFLPLTHWRGEWWMLLGQEQDGWGAFGGAPEAIDRGDPRRTAEREAFEETHGALLRDALRQACQAPALVATSCAHIYGVVVPAWLANALNAIYATQRCQAPAEGCYEKTAAAWAPLSAVRWRRRMLPGMPLRAPMRIPRHAAQRTLHALLTLPNVSWAPSAVARSVESMNEQCADRAA